MTTRRPYFYHIRLDTDPNTRRTLYHVQSAQFWAYLRRLRSRCCDRAFHTVRGFFFQISCRKIDSGCVRAKFPTHLFHDKFQYDGVTPDYDNCFFGLTFRCCGVTEHCSAGTMMRQARPRSLEGCLSVLQVILPFLGHLHVCTHPHSTVLPSIRTCMNKRNE